VRLKAWPVGLLLVLTLIGGRRSAAGDYSLIASPSEVTPPATITVTWNAPPDGVAANDWIALYEMGADNNYSYLTFVYTGGGAAGQVDFAAPNVVGVFEFRYLLRGGYQHAAVSNPVSVRCSTDVTPTGPKVYLLTGGYFPSDCAAIQALSDGGFDVTPGVAAPAWDGTQVYLDDFSVVVILHNANWPSALQQSGIDALVDFAATGGGVVTGEWTLWGAFSRSQTTLVSFAPVDEYCGFNYAGSTTYTLVTPDPIVADGLPASFGFPLGNLAGTESCFGARTEATVFYSSSNGGGRADADGLLGWGFGRGRVASFSTLITATELGDENYRRLFANAVAWAARSNCVAEPPTLANLSAFIACLSGPGVVMPPACAVRDLDCNGRIDLHDVRLFQHEFGRP